MSSDPRENHIDYVEFPAPSVDALTANKKFYRDVFGWTFQDWGNDYADTKDSGIGSGYSAAPEHRPAATLAVLFASDLEAARTRVMQAGGTIAREIISFPGGRRFEYVDPAGNRLAVWSDK
jgi:predicted enzyme related to lactoylglutathione lyase